MLNFSIMFINLNSYYVHLFPVNLNTTSMSKTNFIKVVRNLSLSRFFFLTNQFCHGYSLFEHSNGSVMLVSRSVYSSFEYHTKIYSSYSAYKKAMSHHLKSLEL